MQQENQHTLEKLKIREDLDQLRTTMISFLEKSEFRLQQNEKMIEQFNKILLGDGNGHKGHSARIGRLEEIEGKRQSHIKLMWATMIGLLSKIIYDIFGRGH